MLAGERKRQADDTSRAVAHNVVDDTYREILGDLAWRRLHPEIRARFSVKPAIDSVMCFVGTMHIVELSIAGYLFAQFCRLFGTPLAPYRGENVSMDIELRRADGTDGTTWTRRYSFPERPRFDVRSTKSRSGDRELTEHIGCGFSMRLHLFERNRDLYFVSHAYEWTVLGVTLRIPHWLTPGTTTVSHEQLCGKLFRFTLSVDHPFLGRTIYQDGYFEDAS